MSRARSGKSVVLAIAIVVFCSGQAGKSHATGIPVFDANQLVDQVQAQFEYVETLRRYEAQLREWQNLLSTNPMEQLRESASLRPKLGDQLQMKADSDGVNQQCQVSGGGPIAAIGNLFNISFDPNGNLREEQKKLCALNLALENRKWNENVLMIRQMELHQEKLDAAARARSSGMAQGEADTKSDDFSVAQGLYEENLSRSKARIDTLDGMIKSVQHMQSMAAQQILAGQQPDGFLEAAATTLVQGAVLGAALNVGNDGCGDDLGVRCR